MMTRAPTGRPFIMAEGQVLAAKVRIPNANLITAKKGAITALTTKGTVKTWATLDATAKWVRSLGIGKVALDITHWQSQQKRLGL
jgi:hypothetical protein